jgi:hypothetical protein
MSLTLILTDQIKNAVVSMIGVDVEDKDAHSTETVALVTR